MPVNRVAGCLAASTVFLFAAGNTPWLNKDFKDWTRDDAELIMRKSPWAKQIPMPAAGRPEVMVLEHGDTYAPPPSGSVGNPSNTTTGVNMSAAGHPGSNGPADPSGTHNLPTPQSPSSATAPTGAPRHETDLTIIWASAKPIRLAVLKLRSEGNTPTQEEMDRATRITQDYVIAVAGLPAPEAGFDPGTLKNTATLAVKGNPPKASNRSFYRKIGNSDVYFLHFPKIAIPLTAADRQVDFRMTMGKIEVKRKFDLNEMQFQGDLSL